MSAVPEDAAVLLADFVSSLDNLPSEVHHILQEIGHKEAKAHDVKQRAAARDQSIQKHAKPVAQGGQGLLAPNPKEEQLVTKIRNDFDRAEATAKEKVALSERGVNLLSRHLNRLQAQLELLTSDVPPLPTLPSFTPVMQPPQAMLQQQQYQQGYGAGQYAGYGNAAGNQYAQNVAVGGYTGFGEKRRISASPGQAPLLPAQQPGLPGSPQSAYYSGSPGGRPGTGAGQNVARPSRLQNVTTFPTGAPVGANNVAMLHHAQQQLALQQQQMQQQGGHQLTPQQQQQLRLQQQHAVQMAAQQMAHQAQLQQQQMAQQQQHAQHMSHAAGGQKRKRQEREEEEMSVSVDGEQEGEDMTPYCFCHRPSFGEMIGCDNPSCAIEWFHLACVGLKTTPDGSWFCRDCLDKREREREKKAAGGGNRKGRRG